MGTSQLTHGVVLIVNFSIVIITCYIFDMNKWIGDDKAQNMVQTVRHYQGFWRKCTINTVKHESTCDFMDEWFFSPKFPSWILAGRIMITFAIIGGFISTIMFLVGSSLSKAMTDTDGSPKGSKRMLQRMAGLSMIINGCLVLISGIWIFVMVARNYNAQTANQIFYNGNSGGSSKRFVPSRATYGAIALGVVGIVNGLIGTFMGGYKGGDSEPQYSAPTQQYTY